MANVAVASTGTGAYASQSSITITKPTGLASGDLMVAIIHKRDGNLSTCSLTGWTNVVSYDDSANTGDYIYALYKVADSADAAASNFTFTLGETKVTGGAIMRVTDFNTISIISQNNSGSDSSNNTNQIFSNAITPTENGIIIMGIMLDQSTTQSTYSITNDNPSWTEIVDQNDGSTASMAIAWAYRPQLTSTGNWGSVSAASAKSSALILGIGNPPVIITDTITETDTTSNTIAYLVTTTETITETDSTTVTETNWNNLDKNSSSWSNLDKS